jgi:integrase
MKRRQRRIDPDKTDHHVCLSRQALVLLRELHRHTSGGTYPFPNLRDPKRPLSNNTLLRGTARFTSKSSLENQCVGAANDIRVGVTGVRKRLIFN